MGDFEEMAWPSVQLTKEPEIKRYAVLAGTVIHAYNQRECVKYRQEMAHDFYFTKDDVFPQEEDGIYRVKLNKGDWLWFEVDVYDLHDVTLVSRRKSYEANELHKQQSILTEEKLAKQMSKEVQKEIDTQVLDNIRKAFEKMKPAEVKKDPYTIISESWVASDKGFTTTQIDYDRYMKELYKRYDDVINPSKYFKKP